ncbi:hypothetical protein [Poseidonocella pacifica]|uniref:hypothetical protein n=1 Tax=Poseidonocella pacifica TaxID=871651 RepID=UPI001114418D|nr:hypothetical protein [Poseidonocella pacifica]
MSFSNSTATRPWQDSLSYRQHGTFDFATQERANGSLLAKIVATSGKQSVPIRAYFSEETA